MHKTLGNLVVWRRFSGVASHFRDAVDDVLQEKVGLTLSELQLMIQVRAQGGRAKMVELSQGLKITKAGVTKMVDRLEAQGLVRRELSDEDRRVRFIVLTKKGAKTMQSTRPKLQGWLEKHFLGPLSNSDLRAVNSAMLKIIAANGMEDPANGD
jgi:DNA-binding MarR family transcriptional regulator